MKNILSFYQSADSLEASFGFTEQHSDVLLEKFQEIADKFVEEEVAKGKSHTCKEHDPVIVIGQRLEEQLTLTEKERVFLLYILMLNREGIIYKIHRTIANTIINEAVKTEEFQEIVHELLDFLKELKEKSQGKRGPFGTHMN